MANDQHDIRRKLRILQHAEKFGSVAKTCRYFGIGHASFYRWRAAYQERGENGLINARLVPHNHPNKTPPEVAEKVFHLQREYHLGPIRIVWYLERYHGIKISDAGVYRILKRNGLNRLPGGTRKRKVHSNRGPANAKASAQLEFGNNASRFHLKGRNRFRQGLAGLVGQGLERTTVVGDRWDKLHRLHDSMATTGRDWSRSKDFIIDRLGIS